MYERGKQGKDTEILMECTAFSEYRVKGANPFGLIAELLQIDGRYFANVNEKEVVYVF